MNLYKLYEIIKDSTEIIKPSSIKDIRKFTYMMTQVEFADLIGVKLATFQSWESGRYKPSSPANKLLTIARDHKNIFLAERDKVKKLVF